MRERLMSGQKWYLTEDGTTLTLDLVVDIWDIAACKEEAQVLIGGHWYSERAVQEIVEGRSNSIYRIRGSISHEMLSCTLRDIKKHVLVVLLEKTAWNCYEDPDGGDIVSIVTEILRKSFLDQGYAAVDEDSGNLLLCGGAVELFLHEYVRVIKETHKTIKLW